MKTSVYIWIAWGVLLVFQDFLKIIFQQSYIVYLDEIMFVITALFIIIYRLVNVRMYIDNVTFFAALLFVYGIVQQVYIGAMNVRTFLYLFYVLKVYLVYLLAQNIEITEKDSHKIVRFFSIIFLGLGLIGIIDMLSGERILEFLGYSSYIRLGTYRMHSLFAHPHPMGWISSFFTFYFFLRYLLTQKKLIYILGAVFSGLILFLTNSRKSMIGFAVAFLLIYTFSLRNHLTKKVKQTISFAIMFGVIAVLIISVPYLTKLVDYTEEEYLQSDQVPRIVLYRTSFDIMRDFFPFGSGVATFASIGSLRPYSDLYFRYHLSQIYGFGEEQVTFVMDALWPSIFGEMGLIGTLLYVALIGYVFILLVRSFGPTRTKAEYFILILCVYLFIEGLTESIAAPTFSQFLFLYFIFGLSAIIIKITRRHESAKAVPQTEQHSSVQEVNP
jgi:hypothetical protein